MRRIEYLKPDTCMSEIWYGQLLASSPTGEEFVDPEEYGGF